MTETTRRTLLGAAAAAAATLPLAAPAAAEAAAAGRAARSLYRRSRFVPLRGRSFTLVERHGTRSAVLAAVADLPRARRGDQRRFTLTFRTRVPGPPQGTFELRRRGFETTALFLVAVDSSRRTYLGIVDSAS